GPPKTPPMRHQGIISGASLSPDGKTVLTYSQDNTARLWDAATGKQIGATMTHQRFVVSGAFSPDGQRVLTVAHDGMVRLWDAASARPIGPPMHAGGATIVCAFAPDSKSFITGSKIGADTVSYFWPSPVAVDGSPQRVNLWVQMITGAELQA